MPFNLPYIGAEVYENAVDVRITLLSSPPDLNNDMTTPLKTGQLLGYYNPTLDAVELYTIDSTGYRYVRVI
jgi:hypothetical protein